MSKHGSQIPTWKISLLHWKKQLKMCEAHYVIWANREMDLFWRNNTPRIALLFQFSLWET